MDRALQDGSAVSGIAEEPDVKCFWAFSSVPHRTFLDLVMKSNGYTEGQMCQKELIATYETTVYTYGSAAVLQKKHLSQANIVHKLHSGVQINRPIKPLHLYLDALSYFNSFQFCGPNQFIFLFPLHFNHTSGASDESPLLP